MCYTDPVKAVADPVEAVAELVEGVAELVEGVAELVEGVAELVEAWFSIQKSLSYGIGMHTTNIPVYQA